MSERGVLLRPEANELRTGFADHTQNEAGTEQVQPRDRGVSKQTTNNLKHKKGRTENAMARSEQQKEDKQERIERQKGKSMGQKEVEQMMGTHEMTKEERKQSKKEKQKTQKPSGREAPGT